ncbi:MAG TPA: GTPase HflX, partial [Candidatus Saccharimonadales bacterium]|nr:GTPase HflX [Candidatus Saccharimonadales bacterium]
MGALFSGQDPRDVEDHLEELGRLTASAGAQVVGRTLQERPHPDAAFFIGKGKAHEVGACARENHADIVIFDDDLSPAQVRNLEGLIEVRVVDRSWLILEIFALRARSREAKTQVELARLNYLLPRLRGGWTHLSRQEGGIGVRGGIGETQIELDRRIIRRRIHRLQAELSRIEKERRRRRLGRGDAVRVSLVGYTNAGKTTLFNALTTRDAVASDRLFTTLDPLVRRIRLEIGRDAVLVDTVGFIRKLPHHLVASFRSTLEEAADADVLLNVVDVSHPDYEEQMRTTSEVLASLGMTDRNEIVVFNKADATEDLAVGERALRLHPGALLVSAATGEGVEGILRRIEEVLQSDVVEEEIRIRSSDREGISRIYALAQVIRALYHDGYVDIRFRTSRARARA